ncbi:MAG: hypothetical protein II839_00385 [Kiritimatiellae bacterium]|nr:hypothetical protein [Kiritimatiellia bacterium]
MTNCAGLSAKVVVEAVSGGATVTQSWTRAVEPGRSVFVVPSLADLSTVFPRVGDVVELPPLAGETDYYVPLDIRSFSVGVDGRTLVALEPGFSAVCALEWNAATSAFVRNATAGLAVCVPEVRGGGRLFFAKPGAKMNWEDVSKWTNVTDPSADADYPHLADDVAMAALPDNQLVLNEDATVAELYIGPDEAHMHSGGTQRLTGKNAATLTFARSSGKPGLLRLTGMLRIDTPALASGFNRFAIGGGDGNSTSTGLGIEMPGGLEFDCGAWPDYTDTAVRDTFGRARYWVSDSMCFWNIPAGKTLRISNTYGKKLEGDSQDGNANFNWQSGSQVTGEGTFFYDAASSLLSKGMFRSFAGIVRVANKKPYDTFNPGDRGGGFKFRPESYASSSAKAAEDATLLLEGDSNGSVGSSFGVVNAGHTHGYGSWDRAINAYPARKWIVDGGYVYQTHVGNNNANWREDGTTATQPVCIPNAAGTLCVSNGLTYVRLSQISDAAYPTNSLAFADLEHAGDGVLVVRSDRLFYSYNRSGWRDRTVVGGFHDYAIGGTGHAMCRHGDAAVRTNLLEATAPIVPWIVASVEADSNLYFPGADDDTDELVLAGHPVSTVLDQASDPTANVRVNGTTVALSTNRTVNSLVVVNNRNAGRNLGAERTLTITSGGLVMGNGNYKNTAYLGDESGYKNGTAGTLVFPNKAYIFVPVIRDDKNEHPEIWAKIVSPHGAVFSYPGDLHLGGDQTGIDDHIAVNGTDLRLGTAETGCQIDVPVHLHGAFARLRIGKQGSFCGQDLYFWDHGTTGCKFEAAAGTTEPVGRLFVDGRSMPRGTYGSSESDAENVDDNHFAGTGKVEVLADDESDPSVGGLALVASDEGSATVAFDLAPGLGAERVEVRALTSAAGSGEVATNLVYSSDAPAGGRFAGTIPGLLPGTSYTVRLLATSSSRGATVEAESPDALDFATGASDPSPLVRLGAPSQAGAGAVSFPWTLVRAGSGRSIVSLRLYWAASAAALADLSSCASVEIAPTNRPGAYETTVAGLPPGASLAAVLVATNDGETDNVCTAGPVAFTTAAEARTGARPLQAGSCMRTVVGFTAVVLAPAGEPAFQNVYAVWGASHGGEDPSAWDHVLRIGEMGTAAASLSPFFPAQDLEGAAYLRFVGYSAEGDPSWTGSYYLPDIPVAAEFAPKVGAGAVAAGGNGATISAYVLDAGSRSENGLVDVWLEYALAPDAFEEGSQAWTRLVPFSSGAAVGPVDPVLVPDLRAGRRYYARFVAENDVGQRGAGDVFTFDTAGEDPPAAAVCQMKRTP